jgi:hypothetical protein
MSPDELIFRNRANPASKYTSFFRSKNQSYGIVCPMPTRGASSPTRFCTRGRGPATPGIPCTLAFGDLYTQASGVICREGVLA